MSADELTPDERLHIRQASERLGREFEGKLNSETIERFMEDSVAHLASRAEHSMWIPLLAERFTRYMGEPPMAYLTSWRLQLGAQRLVSTNRGVADIASAVGYESEASFNRAFKRKFGEPPARYRASRRALRDGREIGY